MIWVIHKDRRIKDFVADLLDNDESTRNESKTFAAYFSAGDKERIKDGDSIYGSLFLSSLFSLKVNFHYVNIVPPKNKDMGWIAWRYEIRHDLDDCITALLFKGSDQYDVKPGEEEEEHA